MKTDMTLDQIHKAGKAGQSDQTDSPLCKREVPGEGADSLAIERPSVNLEGNLGCHGESYSPFPEMRRECKYWCNPAVVTGWGDNRGDWVRVDRLSDEPQPEKGERLCTPITN